MKKLLLLTSTLVFLGLFGSIAQAAPERLDSDCLGLDCYEYDKNTKILKYEAEDGYEYEEYDDSDYDDRDDDVIKGGF